MTAVTARRQLGRSRGPAFAIVDRLRLPGSRWGRCPDFEDRIPCRCHRPRGYPRRR